MSEVLRAAACCKRRGPLALCTPRQKVLRFGTSLARCLHYARQMNRGSSVEAPRGSDCWRRAGARTVSDRALHPAQGLCVCADIARSRRHPGAGRSASGTMRRCQEGSLWHRDRFASTSERGSIRLSGSASSRRSNSGTVRRARARSRHRCWGKYGRRSRPPSAAGERGLIARGPGLEAEVFAHLCC